MDDTESGKYHEIKVGADGGRADKPFVVKQAPKTFGEYIKHGLVEFAAKLLLALIILAAILVFLGIVASISR